MRKILLVLALIHNLSFCSGAENTIYFSHLEDNEKIEVRLSEEGCFPSREINIFEFYDGENPRVTISKIVREWLEKDMKYNTKSKEEIATIQLTKEDFVQLDNFVNCYRSSPSDAFYSTGFTTYESLKIIYYKNKKMVLQEEYNGNTCDAYNEKNMLTFDALIGRIKKF